jgi:hypothetical protein
VRAPKQPQLDQREMAQLMSKDAEEGGDEEARDREAERIKGLGYSVYAALPAHTCFLRHPLLRPKLLDSN